MESATAGKTVKDKLAELDAWHKRVYENSADYATGDWKDRAVEKIDRLRAIISDHPEDMRLPRVHEAVESPLFTPEQQWVIRWQFRKHLGTGDFFTALFEAVDHADPQNLALLGCGYPDL